MPSRRWTEREPVGRLQPEQIFVGLQICRAPFVRFSTVGSIAPRRESGADRLLPGLQFSLQTLNDFDLLRRQVVWFTHVGFDIEQAVLVGLQPLDQLPTPKRLPPMANDPDTLPAAWPWGAATCPAGYPLPG